MALNEGSGGAVRLAKEHKIALGRNKKSRKPGLVTILDIAAGLGDRVFVDSGC